MVPEESKEKINTQPKYYFHNGCKKIKGAVE